MRVVAVAICLCLSAYVNAQSEDGKCGTWRLPRDVLPTHYDITLRIPISTENETFTGSVKIGISTHQKTDTIVLHQKDLNITTSGITLEPEPGGGKALRVVATTTDEERDLVSLKLEAQLLNNSSYILNIPEYIGVMESWGQRGLFREREYYHSNPKRSVYSTFFQPASARAVFPCFDEPDMKATFTVRVERPADLKSFSNMPLNSTVQVSIDRYLDSFNKSPLISTYTLGVTVNDYDIYPKNISTRTRVIVPEEERSQVEGVYEVANNALLAMEEYTNIPYPLSKLDHVGFADYKFEGMEHWGLIIYPRNALRKMTAEEALDKERAVVVITHEIAHQWFGNLVTMDWWSHFWLNEAFPTYFQYYLVEKLFPEWRFPDRFIIEEFQKALSYDAGDEYGTDVIPLSSKTVCNVKENFQALIDVSYKKGSSILAMFKSILGSEERFQTALRIHLKNGMMKNVKPNDFFAALEEVNHQLKKSHLPQGVSFKDIALQWTEQEGFPLVTATRNYTSGTVHLKQERFTKKPNSNHTSRWLIPLTWNSASSVPANPVDGPQDWLNADKTIVPNAGAGDWFLLNINATGYYRVNYDNENWLLLARALETSPQRFSVANRAQLLNDVLAFSQANLMDTRVAFEMMKFLRNETDPVVWMSATKLLDHLFFESLREGMDPDHSKKIFIHRLVLRSYERVSLSLQPPGHQQPHLDRALREIMLGLARRVRAKAAYLDSYLLSLPDWLKGVQ